MYFKLQDVRSLEKLPTTVVLLIMIKIVRKYLTENSKKNNMVLKFQDSDGNSDFPKPSTAKKILHRERDRDNNKTEKPTPPPPTANNNPVTVMPGQGNAPRYVDVVRNSSNTKESVANEPARVSSTRVISATSRSVNHGSSSESASRYGGGFWQGNRSAGRQRGHNSPQSGHATRTYIHSQRFPGGKRRRHSQNNFISSRKDNRHGDHSNQSTSSNSR